MREAPDFKKKKKNMRPTADSAHGKKIITRCVEKKKITNV